MSKIEVHLEFWEYLRQHGLKTIQVVNNASAWDYRADSEEFSIRETFHHTIQAIFEDAGNWFLNDSTRFSPSDDSQNDLNRAINRMIEAIKALQDDRLNDEFTFQWGEKTTVAGALRQNLFHAIGHFGQLRNWAGRFSRIKGKKAEKTHL